ncbi:MAG: maltooligosyltrehalose trehalohydrolase [Chthoniobacter sp.]|jgi:maltooligosyltrehalose trehalohydrolase|nr:maltooligosyltrehalose trehalohydrolase [Chthoniobacter sp.]
MNTDPLPQGADLQEHGVRYRAWTRGAQTVSVEIWRAPKGTSPASNSPDLLLPLSLDASGYFHAFDMHGRAGDLYKFKLDGHDSLPDPASRWQPAGVLGPSQVIDPRAYKWSDEDWKRARFRDLVIYELHLGTFTPEGTFLAAIDKLAHIRELGATAIELMPIADFAGERNWGYDGVCLYAPAHAYGHPDDLRALVDAAHAEGLTVILDVVYNHLGPDGNFLGSYAPGYVDESRKTPWGGALRFDDPGFRPLRALFVANPIYWIEEFHIDGFRLDATHAILDESPRHLLEELTEAIHARGAFAIAEDSRNDSRVVLPQKENGIGFDGVWADDFHHVVRVSNTREDEGYLGDFRGSLAELTETLRQGWLYRGQYSQARRGKRGTECRHVPPQRFVHCISNHDQVGNHAFGERLSHTISREAYLAASALLCLTPYTPLLFMGQEWAASTPFQFFTDHNAELGKLITAGRREEFKDFSLFQNPATLKKIPDPQNVRTFSDSKLIWDEVADPKKSKTLALYQACLAVRREHDAFRPATRDSWLVDELDGGIGALRIKSPSADWLVLFDLQGGHTAALAEEWSCKPRSESRWSIVLSTNERRFGGGGTCAIDPGTMQAQFKTPELVLLRS